MSFRRLSMTILYTGAGFITGNCLYAWLAPMHHWQAAFDRSFAQVLACFILWLNVGLATGFGKWAREGSGTARRRTDTADPA